MKAVWRFPLATKDEQLLRLPNRYRFIHVETVADDLETEVPCVWAIVDPDTPPCEVEVLTRIDEQFLALAENAQYVGTYQLDDHVGHVFIDHTPR